MMILPSAGSRRHKSRDYLAVVDLQRVELFGILCEVLGMPGIPSFLFIKLHEVLDGILFGWHLL